MNPEKTDLPEVLGRVDVNLASAPGTLDERKTRGVFYTPRTEVDLICRLAVVEYLKTHLGECDQEVLYAVVFATRLREKQRADARLDADTWKEIRCLLGKIKVIDPACGAGVFLLGVMQLLDDLLCRAAERLGLEETPFGRRRRIIEENLYGVDVQESAIEATRKRLRLALRTCADVADPPPDLHANLRTGDALAGFDWERAFPEVFSGFLAESLRVIPDSDPGSPSGWQPNRGRFRVKPGMTRKYRNLPREPFSDEKGGFDLVLGNPPYVRQEQIADPADPSGAATRAEKQAYKRRLARAAYQAFPEYFGYDPARDTAQRRLDAKSDLYVYFYFLGLRLLHPKGSLCFLTSNTWLDVGYGRVLQEFLLRLVPIQMIIGHRGQRSFADAEVNTMIALFSAPDAASSDALEHTARFVTLKAPFEEALDADLWRDVADRTERADTEAYRVFPIAQERLLTRSDTWGGAYLRAPVVYWTIREKGADGLTRLDEIADMRYGIKTGANAFFYLTDEDVRMWGIEEEYLRPIVKSPRECRQLRIGRKDLNRRLFFCLEDREALAGTAALEYIRWGEGEGFHENASVRSRHCWWHVPCVTGSAVFVKEAHDTAAVFHNPDRLLVDCRLYVADLPPTALLFLNSIYAALFFEIYSRAGLGGGARSLMVADYRRLPCYGAEHEEAEALLETVANLPPRKLTSTEGHGAWTPVDRFFGRLLGLAECEQREAVQATEELARRRLAKAASR